MRPILSILLSLLLGTPVLAEEPKPKLLPIPDKLVVLTFDDANKSDRTIVAAEVKKHGFGATFYISEGLGFLKSKENYTTWKEIRELHQMGFEIGNHTKAHRNVTKLTKEEFSASLDHIDRRCAENEIPRPVTFCFPGFSHNWRAVEVLMAKKVFTFARRGIRPEFLDGGRGGLGPAYDPKFDHPLLVPTTWYSGPESGTDDLKKAVAKAKDGKVAVLCYHGVPAVEHPWVNTDPKVFKEQLAFLKESACTVIAMRDLEKYVDPAIRPKDPYARIESRRAE